MISAIVYDCMKNEAMQITDSIKDTIACRCDEDSRIEICSTEEEAMHIMERMDLLDFACVDICGKGGIEVAENIRYRYPEAHILLIADMSMPPDSYIRPTIRVSALILRPALPQTVRNKMEEFVGLFLDSVVEEMQNVFLMETKEGIIKIPFRQIYYYESSMKKVFIRLRSEEYSYYSTLEQLMGQLPECFIRCHRSFIVNINRIVRYDASDGTVILDDNTAIPVSRSYRNAIRDLLKKETG